tara:strand:- start:176 stop:442 length:267 start_codon:yes stop_codon:yes gene_type:complete
MSLNIELNKNYIAFRDIDGIKKEQVIKIDHITKGMSDQILYGFYYGVFGYHEGYTSIENIRELTLGENESLSNRRYWELPQSFYQSCP